MCGFIYKHNFNGSPTNEMVFDQFVAQKDRGQQGFGLFDGQEMHLIRTASENKIVKWLGKYDSNLILFHHRWPTSTVNVARAAHPMSTGDYFGKKQYILAHNGIIKNEEDLYIDHSALGINYRTMLEDLTFNDSEALLWDLSLTLEHRQPEMKAIGNMAFVLLELYDHKLIKMHFGRNSRPIKIYRDKDTFELSSEGRGVDVEPDKLFSYNYALKRLTKRDMRFKEYKPIAFKDWSYDDDTTHYYSDGYEYDTYDEYIMAQEAKVTPVGEVLNNNWYKTADGIWIPKTYTDDIDYVPSEDQVKSVALKYLDRAKGNFEEAYWYAEDDYDILLEIEGLEGDDIREDQLLLEAVMEHLNSHPEYKNSKSISSDWSNVCLQNQLA